MIKYVRLRSRVETAFDYLNNECRCMLGKEEKPRFSIHSSLLDDTQSLQLLGPGRRYKPAYVYRRTCR